MIRGCIMLQDREYDPANKSAAVALDWRWRGDNFTCNFHGLVASILTSWFRTIRRNLLSNKKLASCADYGMYTYHMSTERAKQVQVLKLLYLVQSAGGLL